MLAILADDLTGAADTGVEFALAGWRTRALVPGWLPADLAGAEVVVIDTASRGLPPAGAYGAVREAAAALAAAGAHLLYKKIDSTLRGPLGAELDAVLDALAVTGGPALAVVCPAFPAAGRTLAGGVLHVHGVPVAQTASGRDPITPVAESWLPALLAQTARRRVVLCDRAEDWAGRLPAGGLAVVDAQSEDDLARIVQAALACTPPPLLAGSAGLARPLAQALARAHGKAAPAGPTGEDAAQGGGARGAAVLVVCGSLHPAARAQAAALAAQIEAGAFACPCTLLMTPAAPLAAAAVDAAPAAGGAAGAAMAPARALAGEALAWLEAQAAASPAAPVAGLVVTGGDTLASLLGALGARGIDLERALAPGLPLGRVHGGPWHGLRAASKAGGFGDAGVLVRAVGGVSG